MNIIFSYNIWASVTPKSKKRYCQKVGFVWRFVFVCVGTMHSFNSNWDKSRRHTVRLFFRVWWWTLSKMSMKSKLVHRNSNAGQLKTHFHYVITKGRPHKHYSAQAFSLIKTLGAAHRTDTRHCKTQSADFSRSWWWWWCYSTLRRIFFSFFFF